MRRNTRPLAQETLCAGVELSPYFWCYGSADPDRATGSQNIPILAPVIGVDAKTGAKILGHSPQTFMRICESDFGAGQ